MAVFLIRPVALIFRKCLQELIEKVMMLRRAVEHLHGQEYNIKAGSSLANKLGEYAELLAAEGSLQAALGYLTGVSQVGYIFIMYHTGS